MSSEELLRNYDYIVGNITKDGLIEKEYYSQGYIYKNVPNYWAKKGICYISEYQGETVAKPLIGRRLLYNRKFKRRRTFWNI